MNWRLAGTVAGLVLALALPARSDLRRDLDEVAGINTLIGLGVGIASENGLGEISVRGLREDGSDVPVEPDDLWHVGSLSKSVTALLLGTLMAEGRLQLDTPLPDLLPDIPDMDTGWQAITLRDVLQHRAGLQLNFRADITLMPVNEPSLLPKARAKALATILTKPPLSREFRYSNVGYILAGHVVEILTGQTWEQAVEARIFAPLGMDSAGFGAPKGDTRHAQPSGHANFFNVWRRPMNPYDSRADASPILAPAGGLHMAIQDILRLGQSLMRMENGQDDILPVAVFRDVFTPLTGNYAGGMIRDSNSPRHERRIWHNGSNTLWYSVLVILPDSHKVIALVVNEDSANTRKVVERILYKLTN